MGSPPGSDTPAVDVLIVDDEPDLASTMAEVLCRAGLSATSVNDLRAANEILVKRVVRCLILDHQLQETDAAEFLTSEPALPPIVLVSAHGTRVLAELQRQHPEQVVAYLSRPMPPSDLIEVVKSVLAKA